MTAVRIMADTYTWGGRGSFTLTINGRTVSSGETVNVSIPVGAVSPYSFTGRGGNKNATGANCQFTNLRVEYDVQLPSREQLLIKDGGAWRNVSAVYKKIGGVWVLQEELAGLFDTGANYVKGFS